MADNGTQVSCRAGRELEALLIVIRQISAEKTDTVAVVVGVGACMLIIGFLLGLVIGIYIYRKIKSNKENGKSSQTTNNAIENAPNKPSQGDSYAELNLADVHHSDNASLKNTSDEKREKMSKPSDDYINVNLKNGTAAYEGNIVEQ